MKEKDFKSSVEKMLLKKAMGFKVKENVDEYASVGEEMKLVKRRITTKYVSPEASARARKRIGRRKGRRKGELNEKER